MDFFTIRNKMNHFAYMRPAEVLEDARLVFRNCMQYNMPTTPEFQAGKKLSRYLEKRVKELKLDEKIVNVTSPVKALQKRSTRSK
jgi:hypothetical protein